MPHARAPCPIKPRHISPQSAITPQTALREGRNRLGLPICAVHRPTDRLRLNRESDADPQLLDTPFIPPTRNPRFAVLPPDWCPEIDKRRTVFDLSILSAADDLPLSQIGRAHV